VEFKSTLEKTREEMLTRTAVRDATGLGKDDRAHAREINDLVRSIPKFEGILRNIVETVHVIQPSIDSEDCRIATCLILSSCSEVLDELIKEGMVKVTKKEV